MEGADAGRITRKEVRAAASSLAALDYLKVLAGYEGGGQITLPGQYRGVSSVPLSANDLFAVLDFLQGRHETLLTSLEVDDE